MTVIIFGILFYGGGGFDYAFGVAVDTNDDILVCGSSSDSWKGPESQDPLNILNGAYAFVLKLSSAGAYQWHTFLGSRNEEDEAHTIALDDSNNIYLGLKSKGVWSGLSR